MIFQYLKKENVNIVKGLSIYDKKKIQKQLLYL